MRHKKHKKNSLSSKRQNPTNKNGQLQIITPGQVLETDFAAIARASMYGDEQFGELIHYQGWREY